MKHSKCRSKIIASGVLDTLCTLGYLAISVTMIISGAVILNSPPPTSSETSEDIASGVASGIANGLGQGIAGVLAIAMGIICLGFMAFSLVSTVISLTSINKDVVGIKQSVRKLKIAEAFNYVAMVAILAISVYNFAVSGGDIAAMSGAFEFLALAIVRCISAVLKTLALKDIASEQIERSDSDSSDIDSSDTDSIVLEEFDDQND